MVPVEARYMLPACLHSGNETVRKNGNGRDILLFSGIYVHFGQCVCSIKEYFTLLLHEIILHKVGIALTTTDMDQHSSTFIIIHLNCYSCICLIH